MPDFPNDHRTARQPSAPLLLGLLALWLLATLGLRPLLLPDEGRYAEVARAMWHGDLLVPTLNGLPFFHKPPLFYWLDIAAFQLVGSNVFAARVGSALGAWLMGASLFLAMRRWHGPRVATIALAVLATTPFFFIGGQYANHDMLVGGLITAAVLALARALDAPPRVELRWLAAGWALCALAMLAKGLIGVVLPALVIGPWLLAQGRWRQTLKLLHPIGLLVFALVGLPWFVAMQLRYPGFFDYFVIEQHFRRFAQSNFNNVHGAWFFLAVMPLLTLPWSVWLPAAVRCVHGPRAAALAGPPGTRALYAWWIVAIVGFFSIPSSKLVGYALPALAPWCALLALAIATGVSRPWRRVLTASALGCVTVVAVVAWLAPSSNRALARALADGMAPGDRVVMVDEYAYDVPFYARLARPVVIAGDWADPEIPKHDNWRKEVLDAARFDRALAQELLRPLTELPRMACGASAVWFIVPAGNAARVAGLPGAVRVAANPRSELWREPGRSCS
jgi:4-amino-4-deoxy-L-arabinose transferase-like glycosyltransferase